MFKLKLSHKDKNLFEQHFFFFLLLQNAVDFYLPLILKLRARDLQKYVCSSGYTSIHQHASFGNLLIIYTYVSYLMYHTGIDV